MKLVQKTSKWFLLGIPVLAIIAGFMGVSWWNDLIAPPKPDSKEEIEVEIKSGSSAQGIGEELANKGLIKSELAWRIWSNLLSRKGQGNFQSGTYLLAPNQPLPAIAKTITTGKVVQSGFTIREGWSIKQMANYFEKEGFFTAQEFINATRNIPRDKFPWLPDNINHLEGFLYPETYKVPTDSLTPDKIVHQMLKQFETVALPVYQNSPGNTKYTLLQWVTLASIVEKEAVVAAERGLISGVFTNRLIKGMTLGSDPTVEYGLGIRQTADKPLTFAQVKQNSPYNTYINPGLPPGPIASPGVASLKATLDPEPTEYLYFVAKYDGTHVFSKTLRDHENATVNIRRQRRSSQQQ